MNDHFSELRKGRHSNKHLQNSYNKYGESVFKTDVLKTFSNSEISSKELRDVETKYIGLFDSSNPEYGYNIEAVGAGTTSASFTEERKRKISESNKGRIAHNKGIPMSNLQKELLKKVDSEKFGKSILVFDRIGNLLYEFRTVRETFRSLGIPRNCITEICNGRGGHYRNYIFRYKNSIDPGRNHFLRTTKHNISYSSPFYFLVEDSKGDRKIFLNKKDVEIFIGIPNKYKKLQEEFKNLLKKEEEDFIEIKNFRIRFIYALSNSNIANEVRQSGLVPEVI